MAAKPVMGITDVREAIAWQAEHADKAGALISSLTRQWQQELAAAADLEGNEDQRTSPEEVQKYLDAHPDQYRRLARTGSIARVRASLCPRAW